MPQAGNWDEMRGSKPEHVKKPLHKCATCSVLIKANKKYCGPCSDVVSQRRKMLPRTQKKRA